MITGDQQQQLLDLIDRLREEGLSTEDIQARYDEKKKNFETENAMNTDKQEQPKAPLVQSVDVEVPENQGDIETSDVDAGWEKLMEKGVLTEMSDLITTTAAKGVGTFAGILGTGAAWVEKAIGNNDIFNNFKENLEDNKWEQLSADQRNVIMIAMGAELGGYISPQVGASIKTAKLSALKVSDNLRVASENLDKGLVEWEKGIGETLKEGLGVGKENDFDADKLGRGAARALIEGVGTIPSVVQAFIPYVGLASIFGGSAYDAIREAQEKGEEINWKTLGYGTAIGASEAALELVTRRIGSKMFKSFRGKSPDYVKKTMKEMALDVSKSAGAEGLSESATLLLNKTAESFYYGGGGFTGESTQADKGFQNWNNWVNELADTFIIGSVVGGGMGGAGNTYGGLKNIAEAKTIKKDLKSTKYKTLQDAFKTNKVDEGIIKLVKNPHALKFLDANLKQQESNGDITTDKANEIRNNFRYTQDAANAIKPINLSDADQAKAIDLIREQKELKQIIEKVGVPSLTQTEKSRVQEIDVELQGIVKAKIKSSVANVESAIEKAGIEGIKINTFKDKTAIDQYMKDNNVKDENILKSSVNQGVIIQNTDGTQEILINEDVASKDNAVNVANHEFLHGLLRQTFVNSPDAGKNLGDSLTEYINKIDESQVKDSSFKRRLELYKNDPANIKGEEALTLFSDAIATGDLVFEETMFTKIGDTLRKALQAIGVNISFNKGKDVYNFIRDYNKSMESGKLTTAQTKAFKEGIGGKLVTDKSSIPSKAVIKKARGEAEQKRSNESIANENAKINQEILDANVKNADGEVIADESARAKLMENNLSKVQQLAQKAANNPNIANLEAGKRKTYEDFFGEYYLELDALTRTYRPENTKGDFGAYMMQNLERRYGAVLGKLKKGEIDQTTSIDSETAKQVVDTSDTTGDVDAKTTPKIEKVSKKVLSKQLEFDKVDKAIAKLLKDPNFKIPTTYKSSAQITPKLIAELFGVNPEQYVDAKKSLTKADVIAARTFIAKNPAELYAALPAPATEQGKSTGISPKLLTAIYGAAEGRVDAKLGKSTQGLKAREKMEKPPFNQKAFIKIFTPDKIMKVENQTAESGMIKALMKEIEKAMVNQAIRLNPDSKLTQKETQTLGEGKSRTLASKPTLSKSSGKKGIIETLISKKLDPLKNTSKKDIELIKQLIIKEFTKTNIPLNKFLSSGTFANAGKSIKAMLKRGFFFNSKSRESLSKDAVKKQGKIPIETRKKIDILLSSQGYGESGKKVRNDILNFTKEYQQKIDDNFEGLDQLLKDLHAIGKKPGGLQVIAAIFGTSSAAPKHFIRQVSVIRGAQKLLETSFRDEHVLPNKIITSLIYNQGVVDGKIKPLVGFLKKQYYRLGISIESDNKVNAAGYKESMPSIWQEALNNAIKTGDYSKVPSPLIRYFNPKVNSINNGINPFDLIVNGKSVAETYNINVPKELQTPAVIQLSQQLIYDQITEQVSPEKAKADIDVFVKKLAKTEKTAAVKNSKVFKGKVNKNQSTSQQGNILSNYDNAAKLGRSLKTPSKGISVFDFDDTLAKTNSKVLYELPNGKTGSLSATEFAMKSTKLEELNAIFDFSQFSKVVEGKKGPLANLALKRQGKFGSKDIFILTARPQESSYAIHEFLKGIGLDIPMSNITGLENGTPEAKANWVAEKAAKGYNDFYFADDAMKNVKAVKEILDQIDVKSKVQQAKLSKADKLNKEFNIIIEKKTGLGRDKQYSPARAKTVGASKGKFKFFIPYSAEDFVGLMYPLLGKGKEGDAQMAWLKKNLLDPFNRAEATITKDKITASNDFKALKKQFKTIPKTLKKEAVDGFTYENALRVYIWSKQGENIPGLSKKDIKELNSFIENDSDLRVFAGELIKIQKGKPYPKPDETWLSGTLTTDIIGGINTINRSEYLQEWQENVNVIFSTENITKLEAAYGSGYVSALKNILERMKTGSNKSNSGNKVVNDVLNWVNGSVGAIMFLNTRSAVLQTISSINFINWSDNNVLAAGKAFANQPQYWKDFMRLFNSDFLVSRRKGLKINVTESEIADAAEQGSAQGVISMLLKKGFVFTQLADSFAIAAGGSTFYRNRLNKLIKDGMSEQDAEKQAFLDFYSIAEESQQSSRTDRISAQQASNAGRLILAFGNTPMQYARLIKKASMDLVNGRGDWKTNTSKIVYYSVVQNVIFNALQNALFTMLFDDDDEVPQDKVVRVGNGMMDSLLRGLGIGGAVVSTLKNIILKVQQESQKKRPDYDSAALKILDLSPPISSKVSKLRSAGRTVSWNQKEIKEKGFSLDNPAYLAGAQVLSATTNIPLDRLIKKSNNIADALSDESEYWQKIALLGGWSKWELDIKKKKIKKGIKDQVIKEQNVNEQKIQTQVIE